jgi:hypothetical protein
VANGVTSCEVPVVLLQPNGSVGPALGESEGEGGKEGGSELCDDTAELTFTQMGRERSHVT